MKYWQFAVALEATIQEEIDNTARLAPKELQPFLVFLARYQVEFQLLLTQAIQADAPHCYPSVELDALLGTDEAWQEIVQSYGKVLNKTRANLTILWMIMALVERSEQFYQQAGLNADYPSTRLFLRSLAETKAMLRRRIDGLLRVVSNEAWAELGFSLSAMGKD